MTSNEALLRYSDATDDTPATTRSEVSQINLVGLQTLTEGFEFILELDTGISYTRGRPGNTDGCTG